MDELSLHRHCVAAPQDRDAEFVAALGADPAAVATRARALAFDRQLAEVLADVPVPEGMAARIMLHKSFSRRLRKRILPGLALAASLAAALSATLWLSAGDARLESEVLAHIESELPHLHSSGEVSTETLSALVRQFGGELVDDLGKVHFASLCPTSRGLGLHLVMDGEQGRVTVLYLPDARTGDDRLLLASAGYAGQIWNSHRGSIAVVGVNREPIDALRERVESAIRWTS